MKKIRRNLITGLVIFLSLVNIALAQDSFAIAVSCTIPAIPGVNAPPFSENEENMVATVPETESNLTGEKEKNNTPAIIQEEREVLLAANQAGSLAIIQTIYSR